MIRRASLVLPACACAAACVLLAPEVASAQTWKSSPTSSWRRRSHAAGAPESSLSSFTLEARFGAYYPEIDEEFGGTGPYTEFFGTGPQFYFGLELDWTPIRIPYVGKLGPAFGWGFTTMKAKAQVSGGVDTGDDADSAAGPETTIDIHAMHASAVLRIDEISRRTVIPIVPYAKFGFGFGAWKTGTSSGTSEVCDPPGSTTSCSVGEGLSVGPHLGLGGMLGLNWLDPRSSGMARETSGIDQAYLFGEWMWANLDSGLGKNSNAMHIGTSTWVVGIALDL